MSISSVHSSTSVDIEIEMMLNNVSFTLSSPAHQRPATALVLSSSLICNTKPVFHFIKFAVAAPSDLICLLLYASRQPLGMTLSSSNSNSLSVSISLSCRLSPFRQKVWTGSPKVVCVCVMCIASCAVVRVRIQAICSRQNVNCM